MASHGNRYLDVHRVGSRLVLGLYLPEEFFGKSLQGHSGQMLLQHLEDGSQTQQGYIGTEPAGQVQTPCERAWSFYSPPPFCLALPGLPRVISALKSFDHEVKSFLELFLIGAIENRRDWEPDATAGVILVMAYSFT